MDNAMPVAQATIEALLLTQALRPLAERAGPAGDYCVETFARALITTSEKTHG
jgi:hypothetical protein